MSSPIPPTPRTPRTVVAAYWIWVVCGAAMVLIGLLAATTSADAIEERIGSTADSFVWLLRILGVLSLLAGIVIGFLAAPASGGRPRLRNIVVALSGAFAAAVTVFIALGMLTPVLLPLPVLLIVADVLVYREGAREWYRSNTD
ncbi:hypothetical protein [Prescottella subtropica]|uniref:hypothetical protein n=1 Tax=Prescottella subtropica TaxID=2545757 RepID=UPI001F4F137B|nr:hypothetical protein [Prescottella subtropica]